MTLFSWNILYSRSQTQIHLPYLREWLGNVLAGLRERSFLANFGIEYHGLAFPLVQLVASLIHANMSIKERVCLLDEKT
jgi:hypothetical protein